MYTSKLHLLTWKHPGTLWTSRYRRCYSSNLKMLEEKSFEDLVFKHLKLGPTKIPKSVLNSAMAEMESKEEIWDIKDLPKDRLDDEELFGEDYEEDFTIHPSLKPSNDPLLLHGKDLLEEFETGSRAAIDNTREGFIDHLHDQLIDSGVTSKSLPKDLGYFLGYDDEYIDVTKRIPGKKTKSSFHVYETTIFDRDPSKLANADMVEVRDEWEPLPDNKNISDYHHEYLTSMNQFNEVIKVYEQMDRLDHLGYKEIMATTNEDYSTQNEKELIDMENDFRISRFGSIIQTFSTIEDGVRRPRIWEIYLQSLEYVGRIRDVITSVKRIWRDRIQMTPIIYAKVIKSYLALNLDDRCDLWINRLIAQKIPGTVELYNCLLLKALRKPPADLQEVNIIMNSLFKDKLIPDANTLDLLLLCHASQNNYKEAGEIIDRYCRNYDLPRDSRIILSVLAEIHLFEDNFENASVYLDKLEKMELFPRTKTYNLLIQYYLKRDDRQKADEMYDKIRSSHQVATLETYKIFAQFYSDNQDVNGVDFIVSRMAAEKLCPDKAILHTFLDGFYAMNSFPHFNKYFREMLIRQMIPSRKYYTMKLELMDDGEVDVYHKMVDELEYMKQSGIDPNTDEIRLVLNAIHRTNNVELFLNFINVYLKKFNFTFEFFDYLKIAKIWLDHNQPQQAKKVLDELNQTKFDVVDAEFYVIQIEIAQSLNDVPSILSNIENLKKNILASPKMSHESIHFQTILLNLFKLRPFVDINVVNDLYQFMLKNTRQHLDIDVFDILIRNSKNYNFNVSHQFYNDMQTEFRIIPTKSIYESMIQSLEVEILTTKNQKLLSTSWDIMTDALANPALNYIPVDALNNFLLFLIKHGSVDIYSYALAWYKKINSYHRTQLDDINSVLFRNWFKKVKKESIIPHQYIDRELDEVYVTLKKGHFVAPKITDLM